MNPSQWSRPAKVLLGLATLWPVVYLFIFFAFFVASFGNHEPQRAFFVIFALHMLTMLEIMLLLVVYVVDVVRTPRIPDSMRAVWAIILFFGNMVAMPVYWYIYIWTPAPPSPPERPEPPGVDRESGVG